MNTWSPRSPMQMSRQASHLIDLLIGSFGGRGRGQSALFLPESWILVAGDMCSDLEIPLLDRDRPDPVGDYLAGLDRLAELPVRVDRRSPGPQSRAHEYSHSMSVRRHDRPGQARVVLGIRPRLAPDLRAGRRGCPGAAGG